MCVVCGGSDSGQPAAVVETPPHQHVHEHLAPLAHVHVDAQHGDLHFGAGEARVSVPGMSQARAIKLEVDIFGENSRIARRIATTSRPMR